MPVGWKVVCCNGCGCDIVIRSATRRNGLAMWCKDCIRPEEKPRLIVYEELDNQGRPVFRDPDPED